MFDVLEFVLSDRRWRLRRVHTKLGDKNNVAPANIRAAAGNEAYKQLLHAWITNGCKLRYSGGMVPDVHHMLAKVGLQLLFQLQFLYWMHWQQLSSA
jgi:fructose-1,6-bisphosphatase